jgi:hypothetical protein
MMTQVVTISCDGCGEGMSNENEEWKQWGKCRVSMPSRDVTLDLCPLCAPIVGGLILHSGHKLGQVLLAAGEAIRDDLLKNDGGATNSTSPAMQGE